MHLLRDNLLIAAGCRMTLMLPLLLLQLSRVYGFQASSTIATTTSSSSQMSQWNKIVGRKRAARHSNLGMVDPTVADISYIKTALAEGHNQFQGRFDPSFTLTTPSIATGDFLVNYPNAALLLASTTETNTDAAAVPSFFTNSDGWVFVAGIIPFLWATIEFWRRIAVGESFGTGSDSVVIGEDNNPASSRGRRVLGKDALIVAYILFGISAAVVGLVLYTVVTNDAPPSDFASSSSS